MRKITLLEVPFDEKNQVKALGGRWDAKKRKWFVSEGKDLPPSISFVQRYHRKRVETAGSLIEQLLPKSIHAVTPQGFALKVALFVIASSLNGYLNL